MVISSIFVFFLSYLFTLKTHIKSIIKYNFIRRLLTTIFLIYLFYYIRISHKLYVQLLFFSIFIAMSWELNRSFKIPFKILFLGKIAIIIEYYFNISGSSPNIFLHISLFRFLLMCKSHKRFLLYLITFMLLTLLYFSIISSIICLILILWDRFNKNSKKYVFSFFVINYVLCGFIWLYNILKPNGVIFTGPVLMILSCAVNDVCAYLVGSYIGGPKLLPRISKRKTISGFLGGTLCTYLVGYAMFYYLKSTGSFSIFTPSLLFPIPLFYLPFLATIGDLIQSAIKRYFKKKDAGHLLPGHGGIFDRLDSMFFVAIVYSLIVEFYKIL